MHSLHNAPIHSGTVLALPTCSARRKTNLFFAAGLLLILAIFFSASAHAANNLMLPGVVSKPGANGSMTWSVSVETLVMMTALSFIPAAVLMMTSFTRIVIVFGLLRTAMGTQTSPPNQVIIGLSLFITFFVMSPVFDRIHDVAYKPLSEGRISMEKAIERGSVPLKDFMLKQVRTTDLMLFAEMAGIDEAEVEKAADKLPMRVVIPAYATSEIKTAFQIGFMIFIPFLIIDMVVASVLMSMGMMMMSPVIVSLPFKIMLFVLVDGWTLLIGSLVQSFQV